MKKILIIAYACSPNKGSEHEIGWQWIKQISKNNEVYVVCANFNKSFLNKIKLSKNININYIREFNFKSKSVFIQNLIYFIWSLKVSIYYLFKIKYFDIIHHVTLSSFRSIPFILLFGKKAIVGPISGYDFIHKDLKKYLPITDRLKESLREILIKTNNLISLTNLIIIKKKLLIINNKKYLKTIGKVHRPIFMNLMGIENSNVINNLKKKNKTLLFAGRLVSWKGIGLLLVIFNELIKDKKYSEYKLLFIGEGPYKKHIISFINKNNLKDKIILKGYIQQNKLNYYYDTSKLLILLSFRDSGGQVILESFKRCLPVFCLDAGGPGIMVNKNVGCSINLNKNLKEIEMLALIQLKKTLNKKFKKNSFSLQLNNFIWENKYKFIYNQNYLRLK